MALLSLLETLGRALSFQVAAAHYNHGLRPEAEEEEDFVRCWCAGRGIPLHTARGDTRSYCKIFGTSLEEGARQMRYRFLEGTRRRLGAWAVATAHHQGDQAETVLFNLVRGAGAWGLRGIAPRQGDTLIRPLLSTPREAIDGYVGERGIPYREDASNCDTRFPRNRIRHNVLPQLREINPQAAAALGRTAAIMAVQTEWLEREALRRLPDLRREPWGVSADLRDFRALDGPLPAAALRVMLRTAGAPGRDLTAGQLSAAAQVAPGRTAALPGGAYVSAGEGRLRVECPPRPPEPVWLPRDGEARWGDWRITCRTGPAESDAGTLVLPAAALSFPLLVGPWHPGDRIWDRRGKRSVKRLFQDAGVPVSRRDQFPVLYSGGTPVGLFPVPPCLRYRGEAGETIAVTARLLRQDGGSEIGE